MKALIIAGGSFDREFVADFYRNRQYDKVIAVDNGEHYARQCNIPVDMVIGDFDTRGTTGLDEYEKAGITVIRSIPEKDDTDTEMAIRQCVALHADFDLICATGGRIDHLLGNIHNLKIALDAGYTGTIYDADNIIWLIRDTQVLTPKTCPYKYISFIPLAGEVTGLRLTGFRYNVYDYTLSPGASRAISNELAADEARIELKEGVLIAVNAKDAR